MGKIRSYSQLSRRYYYQRNKFMQRFTRKNSSSNRKCVLNRDPNVAFSIGNIKFMKSSLNSEASTSTLHSPLNMNVSNCLQVEEMKQINSCGNTDFGSIVKDEVAGETVSMNSDEVDQEDDFDEIDESVSIMRDLREWAMKNSICRSALNELLTLMRRKLHLKLPKDARTLLETPKSVHIQQMGSGKFWYSGSDRCTRNADACRVAAELLTYSDTEEETKSQVQISIKQEDESSQELHAESGAILIDNVEENVDVPITEERNEPANFVLPHANEVVQYLSANNENSKFLKMIMVTVQNIVETSVTRLQNSTDQKFEALEQNMEYLASEIWDLSQNNPINQRPVHITSSQNFQSNVEDVQSTGENGAFPKLPLRSIDAINKFNNDLVDENYYAKAVQFLNSELTAHKDSKKFFTRRLHLKTMLFSDSLLKQFTWKISTETKVHKFSKLSNIIRMFVDVVNMDLANKSEPKPNSATEEVNTADKEGTKKRAKKRSLDSTFDLKKAGAYFSDMLKRKDDVNPKRRKVDGGNNKENEKRDNTEVEVETENPEAEKKDDDNDVKVRIKIEK